MGREKSLFNRNEYFILAMVNTNDRQEAIRLLEDDVKNERELKAAELKMSVLKKLRSISDFQFLLLDIDQYSEELQDIILDDMLVDMGVMSEDGEVLRELTEEEQKRLNARMEELKLFL